MAEGVRQAGQVKDEAKQTAERAARSPWIERLARAGLAAKGVSFGIVATLALLVVFRAREGRLTDRQGALTEVSRHSVGKFLLGVLAVGLAGYAIWRFLEAGLGRKLESSEKEGVAKRIGYLARGILYAFLCVFTVLLIVGHRGGGSNEEDKATGWVLELPLGEWLVAAAGLGFLAAAGYNFFRAVTLKFRKELKTSQMSETEDRIATWVGAFGHAARGVVFGLVGLFLIKAAREHDPKEPIGLDGALRKVATADYGTYLLGIVAFGLAAYGVFCLIQARYREV